MNKNLQDILIFINSDKSTQYAKQMLSENYLDTKELKILDTQGAYVFWYCALRVFKENKMNDNGWEFNYLAASFLRYALIYVKNHVLQQKMIDFITYQNIELAADIQNIILKSIKQDTIENIYKKIIKIGPQLVSKNQTKELYIIAGANGSGKSTLAQQIISDKKLNGEEIFFINADEIAKELNPKNIDSVKIKAGKIALTRAIDTLKNNKSFILESTLSGKIKETKYSLKNIINQAKKLHYDIKLLYIYIENSSLCKERIKVRVIKGGHYVPDTDVERRYGRSLENFFKYINFVNEWILYSNNTKEFKEIAKSVNGEIEISDKKNYNNIKRMVNL